MDQNIDFLKELNLDSSLSDSLDKSISKEEYIERLKILLEPILISRFSTIPQKQKIKPHKDRITFACPYCGDSMQSSHKKRGNIILEGKFKNFFKCFNCGEFKRVDLFFKDYKTDLELDVINYISDNLGDFTTSSRSSINSSILLDVETIEGYAIDRQELKNRFNLIEVKESPVSSWLKNRLQFQFERFLYSPSKNYLLILNLTPSKRILGAQKRAFHLSKGQERYMTYKLSKLYEFMEVEKEIPNDIDSISQLFKILEVNFNLPITLFEGPMDSFLFRNSVANTGANKNFPIELPLRYFYDDDDTGRNKALEAINNSDYVFLWTKFRNDFQLPVRKKWDLNDVMLYLDKNKIRVPLFDNYFSNDPLDSLDI